MSIYVGDNKAVPVKGDYSPATIYRGDKFIAGAIDSDPISVPAEVMGTYNDTVSLSALGNGKQDSTTGKNFASENKASNVGWGSNSQKLLSDINNLPIGEYTISMLFTLTDNSTMTETDQYGIVIQCGSTIVNDRPSWNTTELNVTKKLECSLTVDGENMGQFTAFYLYGCGRNGVGITGRADISEIQIEAGSTATEYEPYTGGIPSPNPDYPHELIASGGTVTARGANIVNIPDIETFAYSFSMHDYIKWYIDLPLGSMYTISAECYARPGEGVAYDWRIKLKDEQVIYLFRPTAGVTYRQSCTYTKTIDIKEDDVLYSYWYFGDSKGETVLGWAKNITVSIGENDFGYVKYRSPTEITLPTLRAIPDGNGGYAVRDELIPVKGMPGWYDLVRKVYERELTGKETWAISSGVDGNLNKYYVYVYPTMEFGSGIPGLCSHFHKNKYANNKNEGVYFGQSNAVIYFYIKSSFENFLSYLTEKYDSGDPVTVWYKLAEPITERIYIGVLKSYPKYTYLSAEGSYLPDLSAQMMIEST